jgi:hypothetical protein
MTPLISCPVWGPALAQVDASLGEGSFAQLARDHNQHVRLRQSIRLARGRAGSAEAAQALARLTHAYRILLDALRDLTGCSVIVDSSKLLSGLILHDRWLHEQTLSIQVVRDPRGVAASERRAAASDDAGALGAPPSRSVLSSAWHWTAANGTYLVGARLLGVPRTLISYRDLVREPMPTLDPVLRLIGRTADPAVVADRVFTAPRISHVAVGNPGRLESGPRQLREDLRWRSELTTTQRGLINAITLPVRIAIR